MNGSSNNQPTSIFDIIKLAGIHTPENREALVTNAKFENGLISVLRTLVDAKMVTQDNFDAIIKIAKFTGSMTIGLSVLARADMLTQENFTAFCAAAKYTGLVSCGLRTLEEAEILTQENFKILSENAKYATFLASELKALNQAGILTPTNRDTLSKNLNYVYGLSSALSTLADSDILPENFIILIANAQYANELAAGMDTLTNSNILIQENFNTLIGNPQYAKGLASALRTLNTTEILTPKNRGILIANAQYAEGLASALCTLNNAEILTPGNRDSLIAKAQYVHALAPSLTTLASAKILTEENVEVDAKMLTQDNFDTLISNPQYADKLASGLSTLNQAKILTPENRVILIANTLYAKGLASALCTLNKAELLTPENRDILIANAQYAEGLASALCTLNKAEILTPGNRNSLIAKAQYAHALAPALITLADTGILRQNFDFFISNPQSAGALAWAVQTLNNVGIKVEEVTQNIFNIIYTDEEEKFSRHTKIAAFFLSSQKDLINDPSSSKINKMASEIKPEHLSKHIKEILNIMGAYNFMPNNENNSTLGIEIEYSNIAYEHKLLTEFVMNQIQEGWSHPGDASVEVIGKNTYSGETTTPIISNNSDLQHIMLNIAFLQAMGGETNASCGLHVHIGVENLKTPAEFEKLDQTIQDKDITRSYTAYQLEFIKQFLIVYKREEIKFNPIERSYNKFIKAVDVSNIKEIDTLSDLRKQVNPGGRNYEMNLHAFERHGTIEVRRFSGTTEEAKIYSTISMITALAQEAKVRTNNIFKVKYKILDTEPDLRLLKQKKTESQRELFMLRGKPVQESILVVDPETSEKKSNTVYIHSNKNDIVNEPSDTNKKSLKGTIEYEVIDQNNMSLKGTIEIDKNIIEKLKSHETLNKQETNQILGEVANQGHAVISHRVKKINSDTFFSEKLPLTQNKREEIIAKTLPKKKM